jgi:hypothetical protein
MYPGSPQQQGPLNPSASPKKSHLTLIIVIVVGFVFVGIAGIGVVAWLGLSSARTYMTEAKAVEGKMNVAALARGMAECAEQDVAAADPAMIAKGGLPPTSAKVPASSQAGKKYMSTPTDWSDAAFTCAKFSVTEPQYFQYQWILVTPGRKGTARAESDLDGDGATDVVLEQDVECSGSGEAVTCTVGQLRDTRR